MAGRREEDGTISYKEQNRSRRASKYLSPVANTPPKPKAPVKGASGRGNAGSRAK